MTTTDWLADRRTVLKALGLAGLAVGSSSALVAGCSTGTKTASVTGGGIVPAASGTGRTLEPGKFIEGVIYDDIAGSLPRGGSISVTLTEVVTSLNVLSSTSGNIQRFSSPVHDFLERSDSKGDLFPSLAKRVEMPDENTYRYTLHPAKFHNGRAVTADDVVKTVDYVRSPELGSNRASAFKGVEVVAVSADVVEFRLPTPNAGFRNFLTGLAIVPMEAVDQLAESPVGCGPFKFKAWVKDSHVEYSANTDYWNKNFPRVDTLRLEIRADKEAAAQAMQAGQTDVLDAVPVPRIPQFKSSVGAKQMAGVSYAYSWLYAGLNVRLPKLKDVKVRKALAMALDRQAIARVSYGELSVPMCTAPYDPEGPLYPASLDYKKDVAAAKKLLSEAGVSSLDLQIICVDGDGERAATVIKSNWAEIGVNATINLVDIPTSVERRGKGDFEVMVNGWFLTSEPSFALDPSFTSGSPSNFWGYSNTQADDLLKKGRSTFGGANRKPVYEELMKLIFIDEPSMIPLCTKRMLSVGKSGVALEAMAPTPSDFFRFTVAAKKDG